MKAIWKEEIIAESDETIIIEGNHYFPPESVKTEYLVESTTQTTCPWKGISSYFDIIIGETVNKDGAWFYPEPKEKATEIKDYVAFWRGVRIIE